MDYENNIKNLVYKELDVLGCLNLKNSRKNNIPKLM